jgi:MFS family permease
MDRKTTAEQDLHSIKQIMERSTRFISLSGLSGILAGFYALFGAAIAYYLIYYPNSPFGYRINYVNEETTFIKLFLTAIAVLVASIVSGLILTIHKAKKQGVKYRDRNSKRFLINTGIPLITGGAFIAGLMIHGYYGIIAPACLMFYGLALINGSNFTFGEIRFLGLLQIILGIICLLLPGYGLIFWSIGFGFLHILYGIIMYNRYDK